MDFPKKYEQDAIRGEPPPEGLDSADRLYYMQLVYLYKIYRQGIWTREQSKAEKQRLLRERAVNKLHIKLLEETVRMRNSSNTALSAFYRDKTVENAQTVFDIWEGFRKEK